MPYVKLTPIEGGPGPCLNCGGIHATLDMTSIIAVGFGAAFLERNGDMVVDGERSEEWFTVEMAEALASKDQEQDWRNHLDGPLSDMHYQRQGDKHWVLYEKGQGFV